SHDPARRAPRTTRWPGSTGRLLVFAACRRKYESGTVPSRSPIVVRIADCRLMIDGNALLPATPSRFRAMSFPRSSDYQLNLSASCIFLEFPAAFTAPKGELLEGNWGTVRQALLEAVRNGILQMLYTPARNCSFQGPEPHGPLSASSVSLKNDQSKFVRLFMRTLFPPHVPSLPTNGWLNPEMLAGAPSVKGVPAGAPVARGVSQTGGKKM